MTIVCSDFGGYGFFVLVVGFLSVIEDIVSSIVELVSSMVIIEDYIENSDEDAGEDTNTNGEGHSEQLDSSVAGVGSACSSVEGS